MFFWLEAWILKVHMEINENVISPCRTSLRKYHNGDALYYLLYAYMYVSRSVHSTPGSRGALSLLQYII